MVQKLLVDTCVWLDLARDYRQEPVTCRKRATKLPAGTASMASMPEKIGDAEGPARRFRAFPI